MKVKPQKALLPLAIAFLVSGAVLAAAVKPVWYGIAVCLLSVVTFTISLFMITNYVKQVNRGMDDIFKANSSAAAQIMNRISIPAVLFDDNGRIIWKNDAFRDIYDGRDITKLIEGYNLRIPPQAMSYEVNGNTYQVISQVIVRDKIDRTLIFQYWADRTEAIHYSRLYEDNMPVVAIIFVDNYEELNADKQFHRNNVLSEVEGLVSSLAASVEGAYRRYDNARFIVLFEAKYLPQLEKGRFEILELAHKIDTGVGQTVTLSVAVGAETRIGLADESARQGMELVLGRGGDQAIVKRGPNYSFYGGVRQISATRQSRVKARLFANALRQLIATADAVYIMGHANPDLDSVGAAIGIMRCCAAINKRAYLVLDSANAATEGALENMRNSKQYHDSIRTPESAISSIKPSSVVVVVDTQRSTSVLAPGLYDAAQKTVIIDHHRKSVDSMSNPTLNYLEAGASSACEMVTEVIQYFDEDLKLGTFECSMLLAGIIIDTKNFSMNTGVRTFEAAGYLKRAGADSNMVKLMYQDDMQTYRNRAQVVQNALVMEQGVAISTCPGDMPNNSLIAAQAADALLTIKGITASFVLADRGDSISVSGRSNGDVNVQVILERIGGGGHLTVAGAQLKDVDLNGAVNILMNSIKTYFEEVEQR